MKITAKVYAISGTVDIQSKGKTFKKRSVLVYQQRFNRETGDPEMDDDLIIFEFFGDRTAELDKCNVGDIITIDFALRGSKYIDKETNRERVKTNIEPFRIDVRQSDSSSPAPQDKGDDVPPPPPADDPQPKDDLPF